MRNLILLLFFIFAFLACKNSGTPKDAISDEDVIEEATKEMGKIIADIRKPGEVADFLALSGTRFMPELVNDPMNFEHYKSDPILAAANIGVYLADGIYQIGFDKKYEGYLSIAAAKQLALEIGSDNQVFDAIVVDRYGDGEHPGDSLLNTVRKAILNSESIFTKQDKAQVFAALIIGNYIEKLYHLLANIFEYPVDLPEEAKLLVLRDMII